MSYGDEELQRFRIRNFEAAIKELTKERDALTVQLEDITNDYHRWHDAFIDLKYSGCQPRVPLDPDVVPITEQPERYVRYYRDILRRIAGGWETPASLANLALQWDILRSTSRDDKG